MLGLRIELWGINKCYEGSLVRQKLKRKITYKQILRETNNLSLRIDMIKDKD